MEFSNITAISGHENASHTIGFGGQFYTLWWVSNPYRHYYSDKAFEIRVDRTYIQNLSKDESEAIAKFKSKYPDERVTVDMTLRGEKWQWTTLVDRGAIAEQQRPSYICPYNDTIDMRKIHAPITKRDGVVVWDDDTNWCVKLLWKTYLTYNDMEKNPKNVMTMFHARRALVKLGLLVKFNREWMSPKRVEGIRKAKQRAKLVHGHHGTNGERIEIELTVFDSFGFETQFGFCQIITYKAKDGRAFKYMGNNPPFTQTGEKHTVKGTIKHSEYKGTNETKLQRIKIQ